MNVTAGPGALQEQDSGRYDRMTIALHWAVAAIVVFQWSSGQTIDWFPKGDARVAARSVHIVLGATLTLLLALRIVWRTRYGTRLPRASERIVGIAAQAMHYALYLLLIAVVMLGIAGATERGDSIFALFHIPRFGTYADVVRHALANQIIDWHGLVANIILVMAGLHAGAALVHRFLFSDKVLQRMLLSSELRLEP
jgi:cytochrome b561